MIYLKMITTEEDLCKCTGLPRNKLWDVGFDLDDWDVCFMSYVPLTATQTYEDGDTWEEPIEEAYWLIMRMENYCVGYEHIEYDGKHYYMVYHS